MQPSKSSAAVRTRKVFGSAGQNDQIRTSRESTAVDSLMRTTSVTKMKFLTFFRYWNQIIKGRTKTKKTTYKLGGFGKK